MRYLKQTNYLMWAVNVAVCIGLGFACVSWYSFVFNANPEDETGLKSSAASPGSDRNSVPVSVDTDQILKSQFFRPTKSLDAKATDSGDKASKIELPLRLIGTVAGDDAISMAIIEETEQGRQGVYARGDVLSNAKIEDISQNQVVLLLADGARYVLDLSLSDPSSPQSVESTGVQGGGAESVRVDEVLRGVSSSEVLVNAQARDVAKQQLSRVLDSLSLRAVSEEGKKPGVQISGLPDSILGQMIGLNNGDVIHEINGQPVENAGKAFQVLKKARAIGSAEVLFSRGDKEQTTVLHTGLW